MPLRVLFLGPLRDQLGQELTELPCPPSGAQSLFWETLQEKFPAIAEQAGTLRIARGDEFLDATASLLPGDELALIPPVSGG
jgi:molybdopterin converting factor small subunit